MPKSMGAHIDGLSLLARRALNDTRTVSGIDIRAVHADSCAMPTVGPEMGRGEYLAGNEAHRQGEESSLMAVAKTSPKTAVATKTASKAKDKAQ